MENARFWAVGIYVLASATDVLDGWIARKYKMTTDLGRVLDPLGDKLLTASMLFCLSEAGVIPYLMFGIYIAKEVIMAAGGMLIHKRIGAGVPPSKFFGKLATVLIFITCVVLALFEGIPRNTALIMSSLAILVSVSALIVYVISYADLLKINKKDAQ